MIFTCLFMFPPTFVSVRNTKYCLKLQKHEESPEVLVAHRVME